MGIKLCHSSRGAKKKGGGKGGELNTMHDYFSHLKKPIVKEKGALKIFVRTMLKTMADWLTK